MLPPPRKPLQLRFGEQNFHIPAVGFRPPRRSAAPSLCSPLPANPCSSVPGSKIFTFPPSDFALSAARRRPLFAPRSPLTLVTPFRGAKSSHSRRRISTSQALGGSFSLLPPPRKPLQLRFGEQNLHISAAGFEPPRRPVALSLCSTLPANPCGSVSGSKIFTFPPSDFVLSAARRLSLFAPRFPLTLAAPFRGAKSSHSRRRISPSQALGGSFSLLPPPREPLQFRSGEQNLHISAARFLPHGRPAAPSLCSPLPANPCSSVPGSKIFTFPPPDFSLPAARRRPLFAPRYPQTLAAPFRGAKFSHSRRRISSSQAPGGRPAALCFQRRYRKSPKNQSQPPPIVFFLYKFKKRPF